MTREDEPAWVPLALVGSVLLLVVSVGWGLVRGKELRDTPGRRRRPVRLLGEFITLVLWCCGGVVLAWLLAGAAALSKSRAGLWLLVLETPFLPYALYWLVLLLGGG
jgi:hypothetical protein